jgi:hypothetical protein
MSASIGSLALWAGPSVGSAGHGGPRGGATGFESGYQGWLDPGVPWQVMICAVMAICFLSAAVSLHAWSGTCKQQEIRSSGR